MPLIAIAANNLWNIVNYRAGLLRALGVEGYNLAVIAPQGPEAAAVEKLGANFHTLPMEPRGTSPLADLRLLMRYRRLLKRLKPDAFLGFTAKPNIWGAAAAHSLGIPVIANVSGLGAVFVRGGPLRLLVERLYRYALRRPATVFFQNKDDRDLFVSRRIVGPDQARLVPGSGVDLDHFELAPMPGGGARPVTFLFAGRLLWAKGVAEFVAAGETLRAKGHDVRLQILGLPEPEGATAVSLSALEEWKAKGAADYLGSTSDVRPTIAAADCVVLPSYYREGVPHILLEAAAMGRPVITTDMPGCRDAVDDGRTGFICAPRSAQSLAEAMERMAALSPAKRSDMGKSARSKMEREFDQRIVHRSYIDALDQSFIGKR